VSDKPVIVFLDANILAKPLTRNLLMAGGPPSGFRSVWSLYAEQEALRHMRPNAAAPADVRRRFGGVLGPTGAVSGSFPARLNLTGSCSLTPQRLARGSWSPRMSTTSPKRISRLSGSPLSTPTFFLASWLTRDAYAMVIDLFVRRQVAPPTTSAQFHSAIASQHPLLFAANADIHSVSPGARHHPAPAVTFRGTRPVDRR
jgi:hypothetical protein